MDTTVTAPLYARIVADLRERLAAGEFAPSGKLPTEAELAQGYGVNRLTLRKAVGLLEAEGLLNRHRGLGTFVGPATPRPQLLEILYIGRADAHFYCDFLDALTASAQDHYCRVHVFQPERAPAEAAGRQQLAAALGHAEVVVCAAEYWAWLKDLPAGRDPRTVMISAATLNGLETPATMVLPDYYRAAYLATQHLLRAGHRRLAFIGHGSDPGPVAGVWTPYDTNPAWAGFRAAMWELHRLPWEGRALGTYANGAALRAQVRAFVTHLGSWPTAIVCEQDFKARDVLQTALEDGLQVPRDLSLVSIGNTPWSQATLPALSSVELGPVTMAELVCRLCRAPLASTAQTIYIAPTLVSRDSVAPPPSSR